MVEKGRSAAGYKLIELDLSKSRPSALIQKGDQQAWIGLRSEIVPRIRVVGSDELEKRQGDSGTTPIMYVKGESEPFTGTAIEYREDGSKKWETPYVDGKEHGTVIAYYEDGSKWQEIPWVDGKRHGTAIAYYEDGSKQRENPYVDGKEHGTKIYYKADGSKRLEIPYVNGKKHGTEIHYYEDGSKSYEAVYENGKEISKKKF